MRRNDRARHQSEPGSAFIETQSASQIGEIFNLRVALASDHISSTVVVRNVKRGQGMGVAFRPVSPEGKEQARSVLERGLNRRRIASPLANRAWTGRARVSFTPEGGHVEPMRNAMQSGPGYAVERSCPNSVRTAPRAPTPSELNDIKICGRQIPNAGFNSKFVPPRTI